VYVVADGGELLRLFAFAVSSVFTVVRRMPGSSMDKAVAGAPAASAAVAAEAL
jgi:hypothetical protein